jgi:hypothetical protein
MFFYWLVLRTRERSTQFTQDPGACILLTLASLFTMAHFCMHMNVAIVFATRMGIYSVDMQVVQILCTTVIVLVDLWVFSEISYMAFNLYFNDKYYMTRVFDPEFRIRLGCCGSAVLGSFWLFIYWMKRSDFPCGYEYADLTCLPVWNRFSVAHVSCAIDSPDMKWFHDELQIPNVKTDCYLREEPYPSVESRHMGHDPTTCSQWTYHGRALCLCEPEATVAECDDIQPIPYRLMQLGFDYVFGLYILSFAFGTWLTRLPGYLRHYCFPFYQTDFVKSVLGRAFIDFTHIAIFTIAFVWRGGNDYPSYLGAPETISMACWVLAIISGGIVVARCLHLSMVFLVVMWSMPPLDAVLQEKFWGVTYPRWRRICYLLHSTPLAIATITIFCVDDNFLALVVADPDPDPNRDRDQAAVVHASFNFEFKTTTISISCTYEK